MTIVRERGKPPIPPWEPLPTRADDPRLEGWYQTIELAPGITSRNCIFDHRPIADKVGLPKSLKGKSALDVGTADGFWAFELERRGAQRVVAIDVSQGKDYECLPIIRNQQLASWYEAYNGHLGNFATVQAMRKSKVEWQHCSVYNLSPQTVGTFDVVFCGSLLLHLFNPLQALINIRSVTKDMAVIETSTLAPDDPVRKSLEDKPYVLFGALDQEKDNVGSCLTFWRFTPQALCDMLIYAGFKSVESQGTFMLPSPKGLEIPGTSVVARV